MNTKTRPRDFSPRLTGNDYPQPLIDSVIRGICPPVFARVDMNQFIRLLMGSYSLALTEKFRVIEALPTLSQFQCDALLEVWNDETEEFQALVRTEWPMVMGLSAKNWVSANMLANYLGAGYGEVEESKALQSMLTVKYNTPAKRGWIQRGLADNHSLAWHVFGFALPRLPTNKAVPLHNEQSAALPALKSAAVVIPGEF
jgi:hypothetical protein